MHNSAPCSLGCRKTVEAYQAGKATVLTFFMGEARRMLPRSKPVDLRNALLRLLASQSRI